MDPDSTGGETVPGCAFPSTVRVAGHCTGSYLGDGVVLTAAHCVDENPGFIVFGDADGTADPNGDRFSVDVAPHPTPSFVGEHACYAHPDGQYISMGNGIWHYSGIDLAVCVLDPEDTEYAKLATLPVAPLMVPTGCIRDWLHENLWVIHDCPVGKIKASGGCWDPPPPAPMPPDGTFPGLDITAVGMGTEPDDDQGGFKRAFNPTFYAQVDNEGSDGPFADYWHPGSATQLVTASTVDWLGSPIPGAGTMAGDSGGPILSPTRSDLASHRQSQRRRVGPKRRLP